MQPQKAVRTNVTFAKAPSMEGLDRIEGFRFCEPRRSLTCNLPLTNILPASGHALILPANGHASSTSSWQQSVDLAALAIADKQEASAPNVSVGFPEVKPPSIVQHVAPKIVGTDEVHLAQLERPPSTTVTSGRDLPPTMAAISEMIASKLHQGTGAAMSREECDTGGENMEATRSKSSSDKSKGTANKKGNRKKGTKGAAKRKSKSTAQPTRIMKKPSGNAAKYVEVVPKMPSLGAPPISYKRSKIYTSAPRKCFRVILEAANYSTEKSVSFGDKRPTQTAWGDVIALCDAYASKKYKPT